MGIFQKMPQSCSVDSDCTLSNLQACIDGYCGFKTDSSFSCTDNEQCPFMSSCDVASGKCVKVNDKSFTCTTDEECPTGKKDKQKSPEIETAGIGLVSFTMLFCALFI